MSADITRGDDVSIACTLKKGGLTFTINTTAVVKATIINTNKTNRLCDVVQQYHTFSGADWANSLVVVKFDSTVTGAITQTGEAKLEIQVDDSGKTTWTETITISPGNID